MVQAPTSVSTKRESTGCLPWVPLQVHFLNACVSILSHPIYARISHPIPISHTFLAGCLCALCTVMLVCLKERRWVGVPRSATMQQKTAGVPALLL